MRKGKIFFKYVDEYHEPVLKLKLTPEEFFKDLPSYYKKMGLEEEDIFGFFHERE